MARWAILLLLGVLAGGCQGPLIVDESAPRYVVPEAVAPANRGLPPRRSPLPVGANVPEFTLADQGGIAVSTAELTSGRGALLIFLPGAGDPASRPAYEFVRGSRRFLAAQGIEILLVTPDPVAANAAVAGRDELRVAILSDPGAWVARAFGVVPADAAAPARPHAFLLGPDARLHLATSAIPDATDVVVAAESRPGTRSRSVFE